MLVLAFLRGKDKIFFGLTFCLDTKSYKKACAEHSRSIKAVFPLQKYSLQNNEFSNRDYLIKGILAYLQNPIILISNIIFVINK